MAAVHVTEDDMIGEHHSRKALGDMSRKKATAL
jgi:hypothetical protein